MNKISGKISIKIRKFGNSEENSVGIAEKKAITRTIC